MKRVWIGTGLLAILLVLGLLTGAGMEKRLAPGTAAMEQASLAAQAEDWDRAESLTTWAKADWDRMGWLIAALTGHEEVETINNAFAQLTAYARKNSSEYQALCATIAQALTALAQNHAPTWKNFF